MLSRRAFLSAASLGLTLPTWAALVPAHSEKADWLASAFTDNNGAHYMAVSDTKGQLHWSVPLPARAHAPLIHPSHGVIAIVARRPGFFIDIINVSTGQRLNRIEPLAEHHFYGHGLFSSDGRLLITQENHYPSGGGKIFVREWQTGKVVHEWSSYGIGPHESHLLNDEVLVVANGGLKTHPDNDRRILNLDDMMPNIAFISLKDGTLIHRIEHKDTHHQLSIRHLAVNDKQQVAFGCQHNGPAWEDMPLVGVLLQNEEASVHYLPMPEAIRQEFKQYCGSVCFDASGEILAVSSPRGGLVAYWHLPSLSFLASEHYRDVCGLTSTKNRHEFYLTTGRGQLIKTNPVADVSELIQKFDNKKWDNHLERINTQVIL